MLPFAVNTYSVLVCMLHRDSVLTEEDHMKGKQTPVFSSNGLWVTNVHHLTTSIGAARAGGFEACEQFISMGKLAWRQKGKTIEQAKAGPSFGQPGYTGR